MGKNVFTRSLYSSYCSASDIGEHHVTHEAEQKAFSTGKLEPLVDPSGFGTIRLSLPRVEKLDNGQWKLTVGTPMPIETRVDTTGSMGHNVDVAMKVLPDAFECWTSVLKGYDIQVATGIFGDVGDRFPLCRPQFEMATEKIVDQLTYMVPERAGGDAPEDPDLGIFGGAYLVRAYINRIGLKRYDFTVTDAPGRSMVSRDQLIRVFGETVFDKVAENGHKLQVRSTMPLDEIWNSLLDQAHAFVLQVGHTSQTRNFWQGVVGKERLITLPDTKYLPHVQGAIIGLTEGTLTLTDIQDFLKDKNLDHNVIRLICESVANVPIGVQSQLPNYSKRPYAGDCFAAKPDVWSDENIWPVSHVDSEDGDPVAAGEEDDWK